MEVWVHTNCISLIKNKTAFNDSLFVIFFSFGASLSLARVLSLDATGTATTERRAQGEINVFLRVQTDNEAGDVHQLLADTTGQSEHFSSTLKALKLFKQYSSGLSRTVSEILFFSNRDPAYHVQGLV